MSHHKCKAALNRSPLPPLTPDFANDKDVEIARLRAVVRRQQKFLNFFLNHIRFTVKQLGAPLIPNPTRKP